MPCPWRPLAATMTATSSAGTPRCRSIALDELERHTQARIGGDNPAETTGKFIAAKFEHDTASRLKAMLRPSFTPTGYELEKGKSGAPEIKGYSAAYLGASSPRSQQIKEQLEKTGHSGPEAAQIAAHNTRDSKQRFTAEQVLSAQKAMAQEFGDQPEQVVAAARGRASEGKGLEPDGARAAKEAVTYARNSIFEREAVPTNGSSSVTHSGVAWGSPPTPRYGRSSIPGRRQESSLPAKAESMTAGVALLRQRLSLTSGLTCTTSLKAGTPSSRS